MNCYGCIFSNNCIANSLSTGSGYSLLNNSNIISTGSELIGYVLMALITAYIKFSS